MALAALLALPVGVVVQRRLALDIVSLDGGGGAWLFLPWPVVLLGLAAVLLVALPVGLLFRQPAAGWRSLCARVVAEAVVGTALFRAVSFPISWRDTMFLVLPQLAFFAAYHALGRRSAAARPVEHAGVAQRP